MKKFLLVLVVLLSGCSNSQNDDIKFDIDIRFFNAAEHFGDMV